MIKNNLKNLLFEIGEKAKAASYKLSNVDIKKRNEAIKNIATQIKNFSEDLINENLKDIEIAKKHKLANPLINRLTLDKSNIQNIANSLEEIVGLKNPIGKIISEWKRPNGLHIQKISVPIGVLGIIYESRPNVTVDAAAISIKSGNAVILRGGKDSFFTSKKFFEIINNAILEKDIPNHSVQMIPVPDRDAVNEMIKLDSFIDVIIPRGGRGLIEKIKANSTIPVIKHLDGICHIYIDEDANLEIAKKVLFNSKMRKTSICGAAETLLIHKKHADKILEILKELKNAKCEIRGDNFISKLDSSFILASEKDWDTEYLDKIISVKLVNNCSDAVNHINTHSSHHTDSIITNNQNTSNTFFQNVDSAIVLQNASTQFADGGEFGFGAEIGISTNKLHVRGPVGPEHLTSFKYVVRGNGQVRP